jgi:hypothetical protein
MALGRVALTVQMGSPYYRQQDFLTSIRVELGLHLELCKSYVF